jgi:hypothetical protein
MSTLPTTTPKPYMGVEIRCTWPIGAFHPGAIRDWSDPEVYEAFPQPGKRVAGKTLRAIRSLIAISLSATSDAIRTSECEQPQERRLVTTPVKKNLIEYDRQN